MAVFFFFNHLDWIMPSGQPKHCPSFCLVISSPAAPLDPHEILNSSLLIICTANVEVSETLLIV